MSTIVEAPERDVVEANAYAIAYRLLGNRVDALKVASNVSDATSALVDHHSTVNWSDAWSRDSTPQRHLDVADSEPSAGPFNDQRTTFGRAESPIAWLGFVAERAVTLSLNRPVHIVPSVGSNHDESAVQQVASLRSAVRRRLENSTAEEQVAGALVHLAGYPIEFVARAMQVSQEQLVAWSNTLTPPPNMSYRLLGDPEMTHEDVTLGHETPWWKRHMFTLLIVLLVLVLGFWITRLSGERPTFGDELDPNELIVEHNDMVTDYLPPDYDETGDSPIDSPLMTD